MRHKLACTVVVPQIPCCLDKEKPSDVPRWECMGVQPPSSILNLFFNCVCTKILSKLCSCTYEIQKFCAGKRKNLYSIFTFWFSLLALPLGGLLLSRRHGSTHFRKFLIYLLWKPSTVKSRVRLWCNPSQSPSPHGSWLWLPRHTGVMWGHPMLDIARRVICTK